MAATVAGAAGVAALMRTHSRREVPLAAMPVFFAAQQAIEGVLWLTLPVAPGAPVEASLINLFLLFALVFWPVYAPLAVLGVETDTRRRPWIGACVAAGVVVAAYFLLSMHDAPRSAIIDHSHIVYSADPHLPDAIRILYPAATCLAPLLSTLGTVRVLGLLVTIGSLVSYVAYWEAFSSVWCFFAAAASFVIVFQFEQAKRSRAARQVIAD